MRRRKVIAGLAAVVVTPLAAAAQARRPVIGFLSGTAPETYQPFVTAFLKALADAGFVEGKTVDIEYRWADGAFDRLPGLAEELVRGKADVLVTSGSSVAALAAKQATDAIPIVFLAGDDPVRLGLVSSLAHPGANRTGISFLVVDLNAKRLGLLAELVPEAKTIGLMVNPRNKPAADRIIPEVTAAARERGLTLDVRMAGTPEEIDAAFTALADRHVRALLIGNDAYYNSQRERFIGLAARYAMPAIYESKAAVEAGALVSYGASFTAVYAQLGRYTAEVLKGAHPSDMPVQQPTKFNLAINIKTAKALGLNIPPILLAQADDLIE